LTISQSAANGVYLSYYHANGTLATQPGSDPLPITSDILSAQDIYGMHGVRPKSAKNIAARWNLLGSGCGAATSMNQRDTDYSV
jgi:hypothetical protein